MATAIQAQLVKARPWWHSVLWARSAKVEDGCQAHRLPGQPVREMGGGDGVYGVARGYQ